MPPFTTRFLPYSMFAAYNKRGVISESIVSLSSNTSCEYKYTTLRVPSGVRHKSECHIGIFISVLDKTRKYIVYDVNFFCSSNRLTGNDQVIILYNMS